MTRSTGLLVLVTTLAAATAASAATPSTEQPTPGPAPETAPATQPPRPNVAELIGIKAARQRLGRDAPTGRGIVFGHVEGDTTAYMPNTSLPRFADVDFIERSGPSETFDHANATARVIYGRGGLARGVDTVHCFASNHWLGKGYLFANPAGPPPDEPIRVFSHSWIGDYRDGAEHALRRIDYDIDTKDVIYCVGVNNRRTSQVPALLASAHNVIAVGTGGGSGASSGGYTRYEGDGRCKPDIVGPRGLTSFTTPAVAACAARLLEAADAMGGGASKPEVIKAVLLAGATKPPLWRPAEGKPLDEHLGAGVAHFDNSLKILQAGPIEPGDFVPRDGWAFVTVAPNQTLAFDFTLDAPQGPASIVLVWNRRIEGRDATVNVNGQDHRVWLDTPRTADLDLRLFYTDADGIEHLAALSDSEVDNVEHLYFETLPAGRYRLEIVRQSDAHDEPWDAALALRFSDGAP